MLARTSAWIALGYIIAGGLAFIAPVAHVDVGTVFGTIKVADTARCTAGTISFRNRPEEGTPGQVFDLPLQLLALLLGFLIWFFHPLRHNSLALGFLFRAIATKFCATTQEPT